jgi:hypothetical protein
MATVRVDHALVSFSDTEVLVYCHTRPSVLPIMFMTTAETAGGSATKGEEKCAVAKTTPRDEFCIPTCKPEEEEGKKKPYWSLFITLWCKLIISLHCSSERQSSRKHLHTHTETWSQRQNSLQVLIPMLVVYELRSPHTIQ